MKLKEVCTETGLSRKTIRLYEEKGLLVPRKEYRNGREYREYSPEDVRKLKVIALLRRAWFTMEEIRQMQEDPDSIQDIFPQYRRWLRQQKQDLDTLIAVAETIDVSQVEDIDQLTEEMSAAAEKLPLPQWDIQPRFKFLDEMEKEVRTMSKHNKPDEMTTFRQTVLVMDQDKVNNQAITFERFREIESGDLWRETAAVKKEEQLSRPLKIISFVGGIMLVAGLIVFVYIYLSRMMGLFSVNRDLPPTAIVAIVVFLLGVLLYGGVRAYAAWKERQAWIQRMRQQDLEKARKRTEDME